MNLKVDFVSRAGRQGAFLAAFVALLLPAMSARPGDLPLARERRLFNDGWLFQKNDPADAQGKLDYATIKGWIIPTGAELSTNPPPARPDGEPAGDVSCTRTNFDDSAWSKIVLPHDWAIAGPFDPGLSGQPAGLPCAGVGWYRKHFYSWPGDVTKQLYLEVDGAMSYASVWVNGHCAGGWPYGYSSWLLDITPWVKIGGDNVLAIRLENPPDASRGYSGGGICRNVWLLKISRIHLSPWGIQITTPAIRSDAALVEVKFTANNFSPREADVKVLTKIHELDPGDNTPGSEVVELPPVRLVIPAGATATASTQAEISRPKFWLPGSPRRYVAVTTIEQNTKVLDYCETPFGIRTIQFSAANGFLLNGERVPIRGVCLRNDFGALGAALNLRALERQLELLQEMGCNAVRTGHNPAPPELLDLCDRMGFLVVEEAFDAWQTGKRANDYHLIFNDWHEKDLRAMIRRDRNHPSVVLWSIGNDPVEQREGTNAPLAAQLAEIVRQEDSSRPVGMTLSDGAAGANGFQKTVDVIGANYLASGYRAFRSNNPALPLFGGETADCVSLRGEYVFPVSDRQKQARTEIQVSWFDPDAPSRGAAPDVEFKAQDQNRFVAGEFVWTGFDGLGEPASYENDTAFRLVPTDPSAQTNWDARLLQEAKIQASSRSACCGIFDLCGFKKDRFYLYQSRWRPELPMAHILPHWNWWPERVDLATPVHVFTSGDEAELFLNGKSLGRKTRGRFDYRLIWDDVAFRPGELKVVAYKNGRKWATDVVRTTGPAAKLKLEPDRATIKADGQDLAFVTVTITDKNGLLMPRSRNPVRFSITGPGEIVATDNGDAASRESFQSNKCNAYNGLCLVIVRAKTGTPGKITLKAEAGGIRGASLNIQSVSKPAKDR